jgi:hypothetical protein
MVGHNLIARSSPFACAFPPPCSLGGKPRLLTRSPSSRGSLIVVDVPLESRRDAVGRAAAPLPTGRLRL